VTWDVSERRACGVLCAPRSSHRYESVRDDQAALRMRLKELAATRVAYGYRRLHILLQREGWQVNHKRVYRLYVEEGLMLKRKRPRRHVSQQPRVARPTPRRVNERWSMDFMADSLYAGQRFRMLTLVDNFSRESLAIEVGQRLTGDAVVATLERVTGERGYPRVIQVDNGPEFTSRSLDRWAYWNKVRLDFSRPGKPTDNAVIESFNGRVRQECLNQHWFLTLDDARRAIEHWREEYNVERPHSALNNRTPEAFRRSEVQRRYAPPNL